ncbi:DUF4013 domain-containing protein [bacterium]|nr:DUF4013 domain-containing protein [bacterium]
MKTIDYAKALSWYVNDKKFWPTVLTISLYIFSCVLLLPVFYVLPVLTGYSLKLIRNIQEGKYELPELESGYWKEGVMVLLVTFAFYLLVGIVVSGVIAVSQITTHVVREYSHFGGALLRLGTYMVSLVLQSTVSLVFPLISFVAYSIYAKTRNLNSMFMASNYKQIWESNRWNVVISYGLYFTATSALGAIGLLACCVGILPALAISMFLMAGFAGQLDTKGVS